MCRTFSFFSQATIVSSSAVNGVASGGAPTAMYRPNFSQAFQRAGPTTVPPTLSAGLYPTQSFTSGLLSNGTQSNIGYWCLLIIFDPFLSTSFILLVVLLLLIYLPSMNISFISLESMITIPLKIRIVDRDGKIYSNFQIIIKSLVLLQGRQT